MLPDTNVLVAAFRADHPHHAVAVRWLQGALDSAANSQRLLLPMAVISGFLRLVTNVKIFHDASTPEHAVEFIDWLTDAPGASLLSDAQEWPEFRALVLGKNLVGNHIPDAWLASLAISLGEPFASFDKGFSRLLPRSLLTLLPVK